MRFESILLCGGLILFGKTFTFLVLTCVRESMVNSLAYFALSIKHFDEAIYLFKLNVVNYPESFNVYDSIGDFYDAKGDKANAIDNYKKVLSIKEVPVTRQKLERLQGK